MYRFTLVLGAVLAIAALAASGASAGTDTHASVTFTITFNAPAGTLCNFNYKAISTQTIKLEVINESVIIENWAQVNTHMNLDTGYTYTETDHWSQKRDYNTGFVPVVEGLVWHLRDPDGKLVLVKAGHVVFDPITGEVIQITPHTTADFAPIVCPALGGAPA